MSGQSCHTPRCVATPQLPAVTYGSTNIIDFIASPTDCEGPEHRTGTRTR